MSIALFPATIKVRIIFYYYYTCNFRHKNYGKNLRRHYGKSFCNHLYKSQSNRLDKCIRKCLYTSYTLQNNCNCILEVRFLLH